MTCREDAIRECIQHLKDRPHRHAVKALEALLDPPKAKEKQVHPWRKTIYPETLIAENLGDNPMWRKK